MKVVTALVFAAMSTVAMSSSASATDLYMMDESPMMAAHSDFDWNGFYVGVGKGFYFEPDDDEWAVGKILSIGVNFTSGNVLFGLEADGALMCFVDGGCDWDQYIAGQGRIGVLTGSDTLIYGLAGVGLYMNNDAQFFQLGGGVEFAGNGDVTWRGEYAAFLFGGGFVGHQASLGVYWHLN